MRDVAGLVGVVVDARGDGEAVTQFAELQEAEAKRQVHAGTQQGDDDDGESLLANRDPEVPDVAVRRVDDPFERFHKPLLVDERLRVALL